MKLYKEFTKGRFSCFFDGIYMEFELGLYIQWAWDFTIKLNLGFITCGIMIDEKEK